MELSIKRHMCCKLKWGQSYNPYTVVSYALVKYIFKQSDMISQRIITVIDVGCDDGVKISSCAEHVKSHGLQLHTVGIDIRGWYSKEASSRLDEFIHADATKVRGYDGMADIVSCIHVNVKDHRAFIYNISRFLKSGGLVVAVVPVPSIFHRFEWLQVRMPQPLYKHMMPFKNKFVLLTKTEIEKNDW